MPVRRVLRWAARGATVLVLIVMAALAAGYFYLRQSLPQTGGEIALDAVNAPVEVVRDRHGLPTIRAESLHDAHAAMGFLHAQDRLGQLVALRRAAQGRLAAVAGEMALPIDKFMRALGFAELAERQVKNLSPRTRAALQAYADGINAFLARDPVLPPLVQLAGEPEPWTAADSLAWMHLMQLRLSGNWREEITNARLAETLSPAKLQTLRPGYTADDPVTLAQAPLRDAAAAAGALPASLTPRSASNAWIVDGERTDTGAPLLANDPHLRLKSPSTWYLARVETPERTLVGATAPGIPFHLVGRNRHLAWGLTTTHSDTQDVVLERLAPDTEGAYRTPDGPRPFETTEHRIPVRFGEPVRFTARATRHGPVISDVAGDAAGVAGEDTVAALAWPALRPDDRTLDSIAKVSRAQSVPAALDILRFAGAPQQNVHLADDQGRIAVAAPARVPVRRPGHDGTRPVRGWTVDELWQGFIPRDELPRRVDPADGRIVNANNKLVPDSYPHALAAHWPPPHRARRINSLLDDAGAPLTLDTMRRIQLDARHAAAGTLLPRLLDVEPPSPRAAAAMARLRDWDGRMRPGAAEPLVIAAWLDMLNRALFAEALGEHFSSFARPRPRRLMAALDGTAGWCRAAAPEADAPCDAAIRRALTRALDKLGARFGDDISAWRWGDAHRASLSHPVFSRVPGLGALIDRDLGTPGGDETVSRGGMTYNAPFDERYAHVHGAGLRSLHNLAKPPASSRFAVAGGASGNLLSSRRTNLAGPWRDGGSVRLTGRPSGDTEVLRLRPATGHAPTGDAP